MSRSDASGKRGANREGRPASAIAMSAREITAILSDGETVRVRSAGAGRAIAFLHGWAMNASLFDEQCADLATAHRTIAFDFRGHNGRPARGLTIDQLADDLCELAEALELADAILVGWSMGAMVAWRALENRCFARRVAGLAVVDMSPRIVNDQQWRLGLRDGRTLAEARSAVAQMRANWPATVRRFAPRIIAEGEDELRRAVIDRLEAAAANADPDTMADLWASMAAADFRDSAAIRSTPILVVYGEKSRLYAPESAHYIASKSPGGRSLGFSHSGHAPHLEEPRWFSDVLAQFAASTARRDASTRRVHSAT